MVLTREKKKIASGSIVHSLGVTVAEQTEEKLQYVITCKYKYMSYKFRRVLWSLDVDGDVTGRCGSCCPVTACVTLLVYLSASQCDVSE